MYYDQEINSVFEELGVSEAGLSFEEAERRLKEYGENELKEKEKTSILKLFNLLPRGRPGRWSSPPSVRRQLLWFVTGQGT